jgi:hypothetical protein
MVEIGHGTRTDRGSARTLAPLPSRRMADGGRRTLRARRGPERSAPGAPASRKRYPRIARATTTRWISLVPS